MFSESVTAKSLNSYNGEKSKINRINKSKIRTPAKVEKIKNLRKSVLEKCNFTAVTATVK